MQAVSVRDLSKTFSGNNKALDRVSVEVVEGEMVALIGASGSGKSTLLRHIAGLVEGDIENTSEVRIFDKVMQSNGRISANSRKLRSSVGVVFQQFQSGWSFKGAHQCADGKPGDHAFLERLPGTV